MANKKVTTSTTKKLVVIFDICSSTLILEDLIRTENQYRWRELLKRQKNFLRLKREEYEYEMYKFLGDGWILLFQPNVDGTKLVHFLKLLSRHFSKRFTEYIEPALNSNISPIGLTVGIDKGTLIPILMNQQREYFGRPLNVASRLQGSIKDNDSNPQYKLLMPKSVYASFVDTIKGKYSTRQVTRTLRNISGGERFLCMKLKLM